MAGAVIREADDFVAGGEAFGLRAYAFLHPGEIAALTGGEGGRPPDTQKSLADHRLDRIDPRHFYFYQYLAGTRNGQGELIDVEDDEAAFRCDNRALVGRMRGGGPEGRGAEEFAFCELCTRG